jgi:hypothetical protein
VRRIVDGYIARIDERNQRRHAQKQKDSSDSFESVDPSEDGEYGTMIQSGEWLDGEDDDDKAGLYLSAAALTPEVTRQRPVDRSSFYRPSPLMPRSSFSSSSSSANSSSSFSRRPPCRLFTRTRGRGRRW